MILHLLAPATTGGRGRVVQSLALAQQARGHHVEVLAILDGDIREHPFFSPLERGSVPCHRLIIPPRAYRKERREVVTLVRRLAADVVHSHGYRTDVVDGGVIRRLGVATVATAHGFTAGDWKNRFYEYLQRRALRRFDAVIAVSQMLRDSLLRSGVAAPRLHLIPNAWTDIGDALERPAARAALGLGEAGFVIGWVGRLSREKGLDVLLDALPTIRDLPLTLCAIGAGSERTSLETQARALGVGGQVHWAGFVAEAERYFTAFDAFVLSSRTEGTPMALLAAIAAGVPVVATRVGGVPAVVGEAEAWLVGPERPSDLGLAIRQLHDDPAGAQLRARLAKERLLAGFGAETWLSRHDEVYREAMEHRRRASPRA